MELSRIRLTTKPRGVSSSRLAQGRWAIQPLLAPAHPGKQTAAILGHESEAQMNIMPGTPQFASFVPSFLVKPSAEAFAVPPPELRNDQFQSGRPSFRKRATLAFTRHLIVLFTGVAATLGWQTYGDAAKHLIAPAASTLDKQQLDAMSLDLDAVRRSIDGIAWHRHRYRHQSRAASISLRPAWGR